MTSPTDTPKIPARFAHAAGDSAKGGRPERASDTPLGAVVPADPHCPKCGTYFRRCTCEEDALRKKTAAVVPFPKPHRIDVWRGATSADIAHSREAIDLCFDLFVSAVLSIVEDVRENAGFSTKGLDQATTEWAAHLADARQLLDDALCVAEDRAP